METLKIQAPALVKIGNRKTIAVGLYDTLVLEKMPKPRVALVLEKGFPIATNHTNPLFHAASELMKHSNGLGVRIRITKNIPPNAGLGSSASVIAQLRPALSRLWGLDGSSAVIGHWDLVIGIWSLGFGHWPLGSSFVVIALPRLIAIDRAWMKEQAQKKSPEAVAFAHFPDLVIIRDGLKEAGWKSVDLSGLGPAIVGFSEKWISESKIPKPIREKLKFLWIGRTRPPLAPPLKGGDVRRTGVV